MTKWAIPSAIILAVAAGAAWIYWSSSGDGAHVTVAVPALSANAQRGARAFAASCAVCHGDHAAGTRQGPPLIHKVYEPSHHGDASFYSAIKYGVRQHHWRYGDMPPRPDVSERKAAQIIAYVRELQRANGIR